MQTTRKRLSVITGFAILLALLVINAFVTRRELGVQVESRLRVDHSRQVLYELSQTQSLIKDAETGQRGFLYTGDPKYLNPYTAAIGNIGSHIDTLADLTADSRGEQARVAQLRTLSENKLAELARTIALYKNGQFDAARNLVLTDAGLAYMDQIRLLVAEMQREEVALDLDRTERYQKSVQETVASIYLTSLLAAVGLVLLAYYMLRQIELREQHAQELRASAELFRVTLTSIDDAVIATDAEGNVTFLNPMAEALTGTKLAYAQGRNIQNVFPIFNEFTKEPAENPVSKVLTLGIVTGLANHTVLQHLNGTLIPIEDSAAPILDDRRQLQGVVLVFRDVTHERKSQEMLRKTEKLASAARLSATVAHEINNPLEAIFNLVFVAKTNPEVPEAVVQQLNLAEQELERVAHITRQTLGFYRDSSVEEQINMGLLIDSVIGLYSHKFRAKNIRIERQFDECPTFRGLSGELKQAVSNLVSNAADAVDVEGTITVRLQCLEENGTSTIEVTVQDDGPGIPAEHSERIFEPFFTTKQDVGTGLGLWVTKGIIDRHGGSLLLRTPSDGAARRGAAFTIMLPVNGRLQETEQQETATQKPT
jgi:PAS domain S-box-containing protein